MKDRSKVLFGLVMLLMLVGIISFSYALFTTKVEKKGALNIVTGDVFCPMEIEGEGSNQITLGSNEEKEVEVTIRNDSLVPIHSILTYSANENVDVLASSSNGEPVNKQSLPVGETRTYTIKLINWGTNTENVTINGRCGLSNKDLVIATEEKEITIKPNDPQLVEGLIPVIYDEEKSSWVKADTTKTWYNYNKQEWANAVTVVETTTAENGHNRDDYMNADPGTPILMDDINTMWVWIPRYEYNYQNMIKEQEIDIKFVSSTVTKSNDSENYKVHPAFTFGEEQLEGFWYGKFETSNDEEKFKEGESDNSSLTPIIKPGVISWRYVQIVNMFYAAFNMKSAANELKYGFSSNGSIDTHMSKNSEWGAVAYLSQSKYGK